MKRTLPFTLLAALLLASLILTPVRADVAPPPPAEGANVLPGGETQVRMLAESVLIDVQATKQGQTSRARVSATFQMRNLGSADESMQVRFPLNVLFPSYQTDLNECPYPLAGPEIQDFTAQVDGKPGTVSIQRQTIKDDYGIRPDRTIGCWATFPVTFPVQQDVMIKVQYSVDGYHNWRIDGLVEFPYVLLTGAGWKGSIGSAEITLRAPFDLTPQTLMEYYPDSATVQGRELRWYFEDFEPEQNVYATLVDPGLWQRALNEQAILAKTPKDGEAWGRLGRWYKEMIKLDRGFRWDAGAETLYRQSVAAYQKALALKPQDGDWHAGYADLVCWNAFFPEFGSKAQVRDDLVTCADEVRQALAINPSQQKALELVDALVHWAGYPPPEQPLVVKGTRYTYLLLTTTPTAAPEDTATPPATPTSLPASPTPPPTATLEPSPSATPAKVSQAETQPSETQAGEAHPSLTPGVTQVAPTQVPASKSGRGLPCLGGIAPAVVALVWMAWRMRSQWLMQSH